MKELKQTRKCIGIDLGTTNTSVAISSLDSYDRIVLDDVTVQMRTDGRGGSKHILPSIIYYSYDTDLKVGYEARGYKDADNKKGNPNGEHYIENSKRSMGTETKWLVDGRLFTPVDVAATILERIAKTRDIKNVIDDADVFITIPASFSQSAITDTEIAAKKAGFKNVKLHEEPKAAILSYLHSEMDKRPGDRILDITTPKRILVVDIGGGTCDICLQDICLKDGEISIERFPMANRDDIGGLDFDMRIEAYLYKKYNVQNGINEQNRPQLLDAARAIKEAVSDKINEDIEYEFEEEDTEFCKDKLWKKKISQLGGVSHYLIELGNLEITVEEFIEIIEPLIKDNGVISKTKDESDMNKNIQSLIQRTLDENSVTAETVDFFFLTGGMAKCFALKAMLYELFETEIISPKEPFYAVSRGAALINKYPLIAAANDKMTNSVLMEMDDGSLYPLIEAGASIPEYNRIVDKTFRTTSRAGVSIALYEGKNAYDCGLKKIIHTYSIEFDTVQELGREFVIKYSIDESKKIEFELEFLDNGEKYKIEAGIKEDK
ncbi:MAG: Hsp70 family protein [Clostridia bacterium]|nr:Hsp70 family protein [Clostridia bacterium]